MQIKLVEYFEIRDIYLKRFNGNKHLLFFIGFNLYKIFHYLGLIGKLKLKQT